MRNVFFAVLTVFYLTSILPAGAQDLKSTLWSAFGVSFKVPADITIEDDSEEGYVLSNDTYYVSVQILDGEALDKKELAQEIKHLADDDQLQEQTPVQEFELPQFYGVQVKGLNEGEFYLYNFLMAKDESCGFLVSVIYNQQDDSIPDTIVKSFHLED